MTEFVPMEDQHPPGGGGGGGGVDHAVVENDPETVVSIGETTATRDPDPDPDHEYLFSATDDDFEVQQTHPSHHAALFYDGNLDDEDESYVYKHMRGGIRDHGPTGKGTFHDDDGTYGDGSDGVTDRPTRNANDRNRLARTAAATFKPRRSDAVLSCPCCFNIVCMDCQKHKRHANQYRAMFVMGIAVDWNHILVYDTTHRGLVSKQESSSDHWLDGEEPSTIHQAAEKPGEFYAVECASCRTQVAALDMTEELYYFSGCLESSSAV